MDLFLDRERLQRFDLSKGPSTLSRMVVRGPFNITGRGDTASRAKIFICRPTTPAEEPACARRILTNLAHRAFRRPVTKADIDPLYAFYRDRPHRRRFRQRHRGGAARDARRPRLPVQDRAGSGTSTVWTGRIARPTWIWRLGCRSFCGAASLTMSCSTAAEQGKLKRPAGPAASSHTHAQRPARRGAGQQLRRPMAAGAKCRHGAAGRSRSSTSTSHFGRRS